MASNAVEGVEGGLTDHWISHCIFYYTNTATTGERLFGFCPVLVVSISDVVVG